MDTFGAMLGPLVAFGILFLAPRAFDAIFVVSFCLALAGLGILVLFVQNRTTTREAVEEPRVVSLRAAAALLRGPRFRVLVLAGTALSLATMSDSFLYLALQRSLNFNLGFFPLLYVATALIYMLLAVPVGRLADRVGRARVFVGGYVLLAVVYTSLLLPSLGTFALIGYLLLFGAYYAATDGVLMALASAVLPVDLRTSGLALLTTATSLARLFASVLFGVLWTWWDVKVATSVFLALLVGAMLLASAALVSGKGSSNDE
jgi:MFS family permease